MKDCRECFYGQGMIYNKRMCNVMNFPKPVEYMRNEQSDCGPEGMLFEPKEQKRYAEADDL